MLKLSDLNALLLVHTTSVRYNHSIPVVLLDLGLVGFHDQEWRVTLKGGQLLSRVLDVVNEEFKI